MLLDALMGTCCVVVLDVSTKHASQVALAENEQVVEAFLADRTDPTLCEGIGLGSTVGR